MYLKVANTLEEVPARDWNRLAGPENPFTLHEFLVALERTGCLGDEFGWWPQHLLVYDGGRLVGAAPMYLKDNSYGEFVFDWSWADAYQRAGLAYYPKLVVAVPYTPATGPRLLLDPEADGQAVAATLIEAALEHARRRQVSSLHWLFTGQQATAALESHGLVRRVGCQYHWSNPGYRDFDDYLDALISKKRKQIKRERRQVLDSGITVEVLDGHQATAAHWAVCHDFYRSTFDRKWGTATLSRAFFEAVGATMPEAVVLVLAREGGRYVAAAFNLRGTDCLYGRHWGTSGFFPSLHFEVCYYQTIDYCIRHGLRRFEAGAQGEHKLARGFLPVPTFSAHWIRDPGFRSAVERFVVQERRAVEDYIAGLQEHSPFRQSSPDVRI